MTNSAEDAEVANARTSVGDTAFETARRSGNAMSLSQALTYALEDAAQIAIEPSAVPPPSDGEVLTQRERQVADLIAQGMTNKEIARRLVISRSTAGSHVEHILMKLGFTSRVQVAAWVTESSARPEIR
ncbi:response regulator transcription factor [Actinoplanes sp. NPDC051513]|uniref:response regulator transcription factor n=1 Tax=Actinoplanes sp. NPDC051513 TaxID=3363908 RepID=UPI00379A31C9